jgi:hypothetical protein
MHHLPLPFDLSDMCDCICSQHTGVSRLHLNHKAVVRGKCSSIDIYRHSPLLLVNFNQILPDKSNLQINFNDTECESTGRQHRYHK